jgi:hypothetical protein
LSVATAYDALVDAFEALERAEAHIKQLRDELAECRRGGAPLYPLMPR